MPQLAAAPPVLLRVQSLIGDELAECVRIYDAELASVSPYVDDLVFHSRRFRGKQLRPMLLLLSARAAGGIGPEHPTLAAVVEMIHTATLVHDDVLDEADLRRHVATVNARWNNSTSVLFGDFLFTHAFHLAASVGTTEACRQIGRATNIVCAGELTQIRQRGNLDLTEDEYMQIIGAKTGELCAVACRLGAHFAGAEEQEVAALETYGRKLGIAFQIADDLLDLTGDERQAGKSLGSDLVLGKPTLPVIRLLRRISPERRGMVLEILSHGAAGSEEELIGLIHETGALDSARQTAVSIADEAIKSTGDLPQSKARRLLADLARFAVERNV
ncbi:MAG: polyprenyl synthetase family protein [Planctomycetota bacterium]|nr:MAG: polyprenyl synthetase family protein [Planctomycetota bacterium]REJ89384.1 MAG: polyprenyl synthetase family protein [Planctomycetota bacterium]REK30022.1 MAG: polyprenyl synthetase family protein [Planctomycetota bacterium]REK37735.1 MAG: polyprenyl synthetase family protein [Planctomycetota bacterium]